MARTLGIVAVLALLARAHERGVAYTPGAAFWVDGSGERTLRLSFSSVPGGKIDEGVRRLGEVVRAVSRYVCRLPMEPTICG